MTVVHWDDRPGDDLAAAVGADWACLRRMTIGPGEPLQLDSDDRETVVWMLDRDATVVRRPEDPERSVRSESPLDVLVFATGAGRAGRTASPRPEVVLRPSELPGERVVDGLTSIRRFEVGPPAGAISAGVELVDVAPGRHSFPVLDLEEVSVVLRGTGRAIVEGQESWVVRGNVVGQGERFVAGPQGLRVLSFRERPQPPG